MDFVIRPHVAGFEPNADVFIDETSATAIVTVDVAGADPKTLRVELDDGRLTISGHRPKPSRSRLCSCLQKEIAYGDFAKRVHIPLSVEYEGAKATYADGMLVIALSIAGEAYRPTVRTEIRLNLQRVPW